MEKLKLYERIIQREYPSLDLSVETKDNEVILKSNTENEPTFVFKKSENEKIINEIDKEYWDFMYYEEVKPDGCKKKTLHCTLLDKIGEVEISLQVKIERKTIEFMNPLVWINGFEEELGRFSYWRGVDPGFCRFLGIEARGIVGGFIGYIKNARNHRLTFLYEEPEYIGENFLNSLFGR